MAITQITAYDPILDVSIIEVTFIHTKPRFFNFANILRFQNMVLYLNQLI